MPASDPVTKKPVYLRETIAAGPDAKRKAEKAEELGVKMDDRGFVFSLAPDHGTYLDPSTTTHDSNERLAGSVSTARFTSSGTTPRRSC